ncbi:MAG: flagellar motor switch protein FliN [Candidatus Glassbacteria bacterium]|nr:flagellar motor switch protein FliN [Candidatus Glassbacteria bacterium]
MSDFTLSAEETKALQELASILAEESSVVLSTLLDKKIEINMLSADGADEEALSSDFPESIVAVECAFASGFAATNHFLFNKELVAKLSDLIMMGDGTAEFSEDHIDAIQEAVNQMLGAAATALSTRLDKTVDFQPSTAKQAALGEAGLEIGQLTAINYEIQIEGEAEGKIALLIPYTVIQEAASALGAGEQPAAAAEEDFDMAGMGGGAEAAEAAGIDFAGMGEEKARAEAPSMGKLIESKDLSPQERDRLELLLDVKLDITIELGRTTMLVRDILELGPGSVVELDKMAGETVDLLINNKKLAEGEVVVVDENFGIRITHLVSMEERIKMLQTG